MFFCFCVFKKIRDEILKGIRVNQEMSRKDVAEVHRFLFDFQMSGGDNSNKEIDWTPKNDASRPHEICYSGGFSEVRHLVEAQGVDINLANRVMFLFFLFFLEKKT